MIENRLEAENRAVIRMDSRFTFDVAREFREAGKGAIDNPAVSEIRIDFGRVEYLDSSALGMLLLLRDSALAVGKTVSLANARGTVMEVLNIANFRKLFDIH